MMTNSIDALETAYRNAGIDCAVVYGDSLIQDYAERVKKSGETVRILYVESHQPRDEMSMQSGGELITLNVTFIVLSMTDKTAVQKLHEWLIDVGYVTERGTIGQPPAAPWTVDTLYFFTFEPLGGVPLTASLYGGSWVCAVPVTLQFKGA